MSSTAPTTADANAQRSQRSSPTILVVEDDRVAAKYLEMSLQRARNYNIEVAGDVATAMEILSKCVVDLIVTDLRLPEVDGFKFIHRLQRESRLRNIPVILVSSDDRIATKINGFQLGVQDFIQKPFQLQELIARVEAVLKRSSESRLAQQRRNYNLAGDFTGISFCDLINLLSFGQRSGMLSIVTSKAGATLWFVGGELHQVTFANLEGPEAFYALMKEHVGQFEFLPTNFAPGEIERRLTQSCMALLMEGARQMDESGGDAGASPLDAARVAAPERVDSGAAVVRAAAAKAVPEFVPIWRAGLDDAFTLGELSFHTRPMLAQWTESPGRERRLHILLVSDVAVGACAMASLAAPLSEHQVSLALTQRNLTLGLSFSFAADLVADVVLIDQERPSELLEALHLVPSVLIVAPADGDWLSIGVNARVELAKLVTELRPQALVGIGNSNLSDGLRETSVLAGRKHECSVVSSNLGEASFDFRSALVEAVDYWASVMRKPEEGRAHGAA